MGEKLVTTIGLLTLTAIVIGNGPSVSMIITSLSRGTGAVINTLLAGSQGRQPNAFPGM